MGHLTSKFIESIVLPEHGYIIEWDDVLKGFGVRIMASGVKTFIVSYTNASGRQRRMSIGRFGVLTPAQARQLATRTLAQVAFGEDPHEEKMQSRRKPTFNDIAAEYIKRYASQKKSGREDVRIIEKDLIRPFGHLRADEISRRDIIRLINGIKDRGAPIMANRTLALISRIFNFGIEQAIVESNPGKRIKSPGREHRRDRVLTDKEIKIFWDRLDETKINIHIKQALRLILVTAQRPGEVISAERKEFDLETGWWTIPAEKSKNDLAHRVPLSQLALSVIASLDRRKRYLFPCARKRMKHLHVNVLSQAIRLHKRAFGIEHFTPHDLRRTAASQMASIGVARLLISKILNHVESGITAVYDRHGYDREKRSAMEAWAKRLEQILSGEKSESVLYLDEWTAREASGCY